SVGLTRAFGPAACPHRPPDRTPNALVAYGRPSALSAIQNLLVIFVRQTDNISLEDFTFASRHDRHHTNGHTISPEITEAVPAQRQVIRKDQGPAQSAPAKLKS